MAGLLTNYAAGPNRQLQTDRGEAKLQVHTGAVFYVSNSTKLNRNQSPGSDAGKGDFNRPFATLNYAITQCVADRGDTIFIKPGHIETLTGAGAVTASINGVQIIGLGNYNTRPKFIFGPLTATTFLISGANVTVSNLWMQSNLAAVVTCFSVSGKGCHIDNIRFTNAGAALDFLTCITTSTTANGCDGLMVTNCNWTTVTTTDLSLVNILGTNADVVVYNNQVITASTQNVQFSCGNLINVATGKILTNCDVGWNRLWNAMTQGEVLISWDGTTNTGFVHNNYVQCQDVTGTIDLGADVSGVGLFQNKVVTTNALSGFLLPAADVNL